MVSSLWIDCTQSLNFVGGLPQNCGDISTEVPSQVVHELDRQIAASFFDKHLVCLSGCVGRVMVDAEELKRLRAIDAEARCVVVMKRDAVLCPESRNYFN